MIPLMPTDAVLHQLDRLRPAWRPDLTTRSVGARPGLRAGRSREFRGLRVYEVGDDLRELDRAATLRFDRPYVRVYQDTLDASLLALLDTSASMAYGRPSKFAYAQAVACVLGHLALTHHARVGALAVGGASGGSLPVRRGLGQWRALCAFIAALSPRAAPSLDGSLARVPRLSGRGLVVILSDFYPPERFLRALQQLAAGPRTVVALQLLSPQERRPALDGEHELVDLESGESRRGWIGTVERAAYQRALGELQQRLRSICQHMGVRYAPLWTDVPIVRCFEDTLVRLGVLCRSGSDGA